MSKSILLYLELSHIFGLWEVCGKVLSGITAVECASSYKERSERLEPGGKMSTKCWAEPLID